MNRADWAARQVQAMLEAWDQREAAIARGMAQHNAEMDLLRAQMAQNAGDLERNHQNPMPAPRPPAPPAPKPPPQPPPPRK